MMAGHPPFNKADPSSDPFYNKIAINRPDVFWKSHSANKKQGFFSDDFKHLITFMMQVDPTLRLSIEEIKAHPWYTKPIPTAEQIKEHFIKKKKKVDHDA
jgi:serine/threonine protein kinase